MYNASQLLLPAAKPARTDSSLLGHPDSEVKIEEKDASPLSLRQALQEYYRTKDKLPANIDGRQLPIVEVQLSLVESVREKRRRSEEKRDEDEKEIPAGKKAGSDKDSDKGQQAPSLLEREENDSLRYYEDWHNVREENITVDKMF